MIRGMYTAISSLVTLEAKQGVITNNLANVNTPGFKPDELIISQFDKVMMSNRDGTLGGSRNLGEMSIGSKIESTRTKFNQGSFKRTDKMTDFALDGAGFFTVRQGEEEFYTRDGAFIIDIQGNLKTSSGASVMGVNLSTGNYEPINIEGAINIGIDGNNNLIVEGNPTYKLRISSFRDYTTLEKVAYNLYKGQEPFESVNTRVQNGMLESSQVDAAEEMVNLTNTLRSFESSMKVLKYLDESLRISANEIGKV